MVSEEHISSEKNEMAIRIGVKPTICFLRALFTLYRVYITVKSHEIDFDREKIVLLNDQYAKLTHHSGKIWWYH